MLRVLIRITSLSTHNIPSSIKKKKRKSPYKICSYGIFSKGLKNEFEIAVVNEPSVFEQLKFYCIWSNHNDDIWVHLFVFQPFLKENIFVAPSLLLLWFPVCFPGPQSL